MDLHVNESRLISDLETLASLSSLQPQPVHPAGGTAVTRIVFSEDDLRARAWLKSRAAEIGLSIREDAVGNTFFRFEGTDPTLPAVGTGSHFDAIPYAGMYDGTVGVLGGLEAIRALKSAGLRGRRSIELVLFTSEEPTRFGIGCLGSRLISGTLDPERADQLHGAERGKEDETLASVRKAAGFSGPLSSCRLAPGHYSAWLELHIEQGPLLEREGLPVGVVTAIAAPASYRFVVAGFGGHAGALLMPDRRDALCAASEIILSVERHVLASGAIDTVGTIGTCDVYPGAVNSVPSRVILQLDIRDTDPARREAAMEGIRRDIEDIRDRRGVTVSETLVNADEPATCDAHLLSVIEEAAKAQGISTKRMVSRAYHDSLFMAQVAPVAMIFIPCRNGVSHRPDEYATPTDIARGTEVLARTLARLAAE